MPCAGRSFQIGRGDVTILRMQTAKLDAGRVDLAHEADDGGEVLLLHSGAVHSGIHVDEDARGKPCQASARREFSITTETRTLRFSSAGFRDARRVGSHHRIGEQDILHSGSAGAVEFHRSGRERTSDLNRILL